MKTPWRFYWLGKASELGVWALDRGVGTPIWRVNDVVFANAASATDHDAVCRPHGWMTGSIAKVIAPQGVFISTEVQAAYGLHAVDAAVIYPAGR